MPKVKMEQLHWSFQGPEKHTNTTVSVFSPWTESEPLFVVKSESPSWSASPADFSAWVDALVRFRDENP